MPDLRVEITPVVVDADPETLNSRRNIVQRLENLGQLTAADGHINPKTTAGWQATVNGGGPILLEAYAVEPADDGRVLVSLVVPADTVSVGRSPASTPAPAAAKKPTVGVWGASGLPDPREKIPGWTPKSSTDKHDHTLTMWTCGCDPVLLGIQEAATKTGNIDLTVASLGEQVARNAGRLA